jgi:hypothetical protein
LKEIFFIYPVFIRYAGKNLLTFGQSSPLPVKPVIKTADVGLGHMIMPPGFFMLPGHAPMVFGSWS